MKALVVGALAGLLFVLGYLLLVIGPDLEWDITAVGFAADSFILSCCSTTKALLP